MHGRRSYVRFSIANSEGLLSVSRDVLVQRTTSDGFVALDQDARRVGDRATLETVIDDSVIVREVRVTACRPVVRNGTIFHELHLVAVDDWADADALVPIKRADDLEI